jgi:hypothetical protein
MEDALAMMELSAEVTAGLAAAAKNGEPEPARPSEGSVTCSAGLAELEAELDILEWVAENLSAAGDGEGCLEADAKAKALRKRIEAERGHSATAEVSDRGQETP